MPSSIDSTVRPFLRIPPFPGARAGALARRGIGRDELSDEELDVAIAAIVRARVGGEFWGQQPPLPARPYVLVRLGSRSARARVLNALPEEQHAVCWVDSRREAGRAGASVSYVVGRCDPWHLISSATEVHADPGDDLLAIAALTGVPAFHHDRYEPNATGDGSQTLLRETLSGSLTYVDPMLDEPMTLAGAIELCAFWRRLIDSNRPVSAAIGFAAWKRATAEPLLWGGSRLNFVARPHRVTADDQLFTWKSRIPAAALVQLERSGAELIEVEDGFIRSVGLGANCVPPLSLVVDRLGAYFDPQGPSELERLLQEGEFPAPILERARSLRAMIVAGAISKYGAGQQAVGRRKDQCLHILVPGQVEDDRSVQCGGGMVTGNLELLRRVREVAADAYILYKPHPDVEAGHRVGAVPDEVALSFADEVVRGQSITSLIDMVDEVHVNTSLAGFEALMRDRAVTTHGTPFYAGWGLTTDLGTIPGRRTARRTLDELVAAALLLYPRYLDPVTGLPCTPEILITRLAEGTGARRQGALVPLRRLQGHLKRQLANVLRW